MGIQFMFFVSFLIITELCYFNIFLFAKLLGKQKKRQQTKTTEKVDLALGHKLVKRHLNRKGTPTPRLHHNPITAPCVCECARACVSF